MRIGKAKLIIDPYEWLPSYGETKVSFHSIGMDVVVTVEYDRDVFDGEDAATVAYMSRDIVFKGARGFMRAPFPGVDFFEAEAGLSKFGLGELSEFENSEWAESSLRAYNSFSPANFLVLRHFAIRFLSENVSFHVLAESLYLSEERVMV